MVPTDCPKQLLVEAYLATRADLLAEASASQDDIALIYKIRDALRTLLGLEPGDDEPTITGEAKMVALSIDHDDDDSGEASILVGYNGPNWESIREIDLVVKDPHTVPSLFFDATSSAWSLAKRLHLVKSREMDCAELTMRS